MADPNRKPVMFESWEDFMRMHRAVLKVEQMSSSTPIVPDYARIGPEAIDTAVLSFQVTNLTPNHHGWYSAFIAYRQANAQPPDALYVLDEENFYVQGLNQETLALDYYLGIVCDDTVGVETAAVVSGSSINVGGTSNLLTGDTVDIYWTITAVDYSRTGILLGTISGGIAAVSGGSGDAFPADGVAITYIPLNSGIRMPTAVVSVGGGGGSEYEHPRWVEVIDDTPIGIGDVNYWKGKLIDKDDLGGRSLGIEVRCRIIDASGGAGPIGDRLIGPSSYTDGKGGDYFMTRNGTIAETVMDITTTYDLYDHSGNVGVVLPDCDADGNPICTRYDWTAPTRVVKNVDCILGTPL